MLKDLQPQLLALSRTEKAQAIQLLAASLGGVWAGIEKATGVMGGDACIRQTQLPVWLLVSLRRQGATEAYLLACIIHNAKEMPVIPVETGIYAKQPTPDWVPAPRLRGGRHYAGMTAFNVCSRE